MLSKAINRFQNNQELVFPDSLRVILRNEVFYGYDNKIAHTGL